MQPQVETPRFVGSVLTILAAGLLALLTRFMGAGEAAPRAPALVLQLANNAANPAATMVGGAEENLRAFKAVQDCRRANPGKVAETFEGFGYKWTLIKGVWSTGFEASTLTPRNHPDEKVWVTPMENVKSDYIPREDNPVASLSVHVGGYLSPPGKYGRLGLYSREIYATKITLHDD